MTFRSRGYSFLLLLSIAALSAQQTKTANNPPRPPAGAQNQETASALSWAPTVTHLTTPAGEPGDLIGAVMSWQYYAYGGPYDSASMFVNTGGLAGAFQGYFNIQTRPRSISFVYAIASESGTWSPSAQSLPPTIYNGIAINMIDGPPFTSVTIDPATNMVGFDSSRISFTADQIQVDWQNLSWTTSTIVRLDVNQPRPN